MVTTSTTRPSEVPPHPRGDRPDRPDQLPVTGSATGILLALGAGVLAAGVAFVVASRRRLGRADH